MNTLLKALGALAIVALLTTALVADDAPLISAADADRMARSGDVLLVDIRQPWEWQQTGVSPDAHTISMHLPGFLERIHELTGGDRQAQIALICARGGRSARIQSQLGQEGYTNVLDVAEGMLGSRHGAGWLAADLPVTPYAASD